MRSIPALRVVRYLGWLAVAGSVGVVLAATIVEAIQSVPTMPTLWPTARLWRYFQTTILMACTTTLLSLVLAIPAAIALAQAAKPNQRHLLASLIILPLITMPGIFAYAWMLLATRPSGLAARCLNSIGWNTPGAEPFQAALVLACWLWPISALVLASSFSQMGRVGYLLARLDATAVKAFLRGAIPLMRAPLVAAMAITFVLAASDSTVPPLMGASEVWAVEMMALASAAAGEAHPVGFLFWQSWPMLALIACAMLVALPGLRQMTHWADEPDWLDSGTGGVRIPSVWWIACICAVSITAFPVVVYGVELGHGRTGIAESVATAYRTFRSDGLATVLVGLLTTLTGLAASVAVVGDDRDYSVARIAGLLVLAGSIAMAMLPPELAGTALASAYARVSDPSSPWSVYDCTPWVWTAAMLARFSFLPVGVAWLLNRRVPESLLAQASVDGWGGLARIAHVRIPFLWKPVLAAAIISGCLAISEVAASVLVQPPRFLGGSLAVKVDMQMHYGRQDQTVALALMLLLPSALGAWLAPMLIQRAAR